MADNIYVVEDEVPNPATVETPLDSDGSDWLKISGTYIEDTAITLTWTSDAGTATSASGQYFTNGNESHRLIVHGLIENVLGSNGNDFIGGNEVGNILYGDNSSTGPGGNDTIGGAEGNDTIYGGSGADSISGANDDDWLYGDSGSDTISGGAGDDLVEGGAGADVLSGGSDARDAVSYFHSNAGVNIKITFGAGTTGIGGHAQGDTIQGFADVAGSDFNDIITDTVNGTVAFGGNDNLFLGMGGADRLTLGGGADTGGGGNGNDVIFGGAGIDQLFGEAGNDSLRGGTQRDLLQGNAGADQFIFAALNESTVASAGRDVISDFSRAQHDKINLAAIDAKAGLAGNNAFHFIGVQAFTGAKGDLRIVDSGANLIVMGDVNGDKKADFAILVQNTASLNAGDFLL